MKQLDTTFDHRKKEPAIWADWIDKGLFEASQDQSKEPYTILIPPPNVTDRLHMGHGLNNTIQDILIRWKRMRGYDCLWLPGTDHAGIATQMMVEKDLTEKGLTKEELGRETFFRYCQEWKEKNGGIIIDQLKRLGASCDWSRQAYTMDEKLSKAVRKMFVDLYKDGLIYRSERLVNWDTKLKTALSNDEVNNQEVNGHLWYYRYPVKDSQDYVTIATTRPETMFGDMAIAINPADEKNHHLIGREAIIPFANRVIPIIGDSYVKSDFGSGCVKITPAHDPNDFLMGKRHGLAFLNIMNEDGSLNENVPEEFKGLDRLVARALIVKKLKADNLLEKKEKNRHSVPISDRSKTVVEPRLSKQWYVKMDTLAAPALQYVQENQLKFHPESWKKTYFHWLDNIQDWCISRQLWWGHQIPIWYCGDCSGVSCDMEDVQECSHCGSTNLERDKDVLDTWFSSWLWPISPMGWPEKTADLERFFPSNVLVTGPDIIFLWVARMVMVSHYTMEALPFKDVYFNSIICDKNGQKFSKTLGNGIDPLEVIDQHGADAVRFTCISLAPLGGRVKMALGDFDNGAKFINKIWNSARFLQNKIPEAFVPKPIEDCRLDLPLKWLMTKLHETSEKISTLLENYQINEATDLLFQFIWKDYCDWGLEATKISSLETPEELNDQCSALLFVFEGLLRLASPFIPFVTEEIWSSIPRHPSWDHSESLAVATFPSPSRLASYPEEAKDWEIQQELISGIRSIRTQAQVPPKEEIKVFIEGDEKTLGIINSGLPWIKGFCKIETIQSNTKLKERPRRCMLAVGRGWSAYVPVDTYLDIDKEKKRQNAEALRLEKIIRSLETKLNNKSFVERAPQAVLEATREQLSNLNRQHHVIKETISALSE